MARLVLEQIDDRASPSPVSQGGVRSGRVSSAAGELSVALWLERRHLTALLGALASKPGPASARIGTPAAAAADVERRVEGLRAAGLWRALAVDTLARALGVRDLTLSEVVSSMSAEPWTFIFASHRDAMQAQLDQLERHHHDGGSDGGCPGSFRAFVYGSRD